MFIVFVIGVIVGILAVSTILKLTMNPRPKSCLIAVGIVLTLAAMVLITLYQVAQTISIYL